MFANLVVAFADSIPASARQERDLVIVGRPSQLPLLRELGSALPAAFPEGSDVLGEANMG